MLNILVVEDDEAISELILLNLRVAGYEPHAVFDGQQALDALQSETFSLALLDIMLPVLDGFALFPHFEKRNIPVVFLTAKNDTASKIHGLRQAEDYIVKPFDILELMVRIEKVLARTGCLHTIQIGEIEICEQERSVKKGGVPVVLKPLEFDLLLSLAKNKNIAMSREALLSAVWGIDFVGETRTVDVHIAQLRKKLGVSVATLPKVGYRLED